MKDLAQQIEEAERKWPDALEKIEKGVIASVLGVQRADLISLKCKIRRGKRCLVAEYKAKHTVEIAQEL